MEFNNLNELKIRVTPALETRVTDYKNNNINNITSDDIWNYLKDNMWKQAHNLTLAKMVDDILKCDYKDILLYKLDK